MADTNLNIKINAQGNLNAVLSQAMQQLDQVGLKGKAASQGTNINQQSFFSQSTMALMSGTGQIIKGLGDKMAGFTQNIRMARAATESARNGLASMGTSVEDLNILENTAKGIGEKFGIAKSQILDAAYNLKGGMSFLTSSGLNNIMEVGVQLGAATKATSEDISNLLANAGNTLGGSLQKDEKAFVEFQYQFANSAAAVVNIGKAEGSQVAAFTKNLASGLQNVGQDLATQQALATVAITTQGSGERGATVINSGLAKNWFRYMKTLEQVGIKTKDANGKIRSMVPIFEELKAKTANMGLEQKNSFLGHIFGSPKSGKMDTYVDKAVNMAINNAGLLRTAYDESNKAIIEGTKAARGELNLTDTMMGKMAKSFQQGPAFTMEQMKVKQQNLMEEMALNIKSSTSPLITLKTKFLDFAKTIVANKPQLVGTFLGMSEMIGTSISSVGGFITQTGNVFRSFESIKLFLNTMKGFNLFKGGGLKNILPSGNDFKLKFKPDYTPQPSMLANLGRAISTTVSNGFKRTGAVLSYVVSNALDGIKNKIATKIAAPISSALSKAANSINSKIAGTGFANFTSKLGSGMSSFGKGIADRVKGIDWKGTLKGIGSGLLKIGGLALGAGALLAPMMMKDPAFAKDINEMVKLLKDSVGVLLKDISAALKPLMPTIKTVFKDLLSSLMPVVKKLLALIMPLLPPLVQIIDQIAKAIIPLLPPIMEIFQVLVDVLLDVMPSILDAVMPLVEALLPLLKSIIVPVIKASGEILKGILKAVYYLIPESMLSNEQRMKKYVGIAQDRKTVEGKMDAGRQFVAYALDSLPQFKAKYGDINYQNLEEKKKLMTPQEQAAIDKVLVAFTKDKMNQMDISTASDLMLRTIEHGSKGVFYGKDNEATTWQNANARTTANNEQLASLIAYNMNDKNYESGYGKTSGVWDWATAVDDNKKATIEKKKKEDQDKVLAGVNFYKYRPPTVNIQEGTIIVKNAGPNVEIEKQKPSITTKESQHDYKVMSNEANLDFNRTSSKPS